MTQLLANRKRDVWTLVDDVDVSRLDGFRLCVLFLRKETPYVYLRRRGERQVALSRFLMSAPDGMVVDHINGDTTDNRKANLRICSYAQNSMNRKPHGQASKYRGVTWGSRQKKWKAAIQKDRKQQHIGYFKVEEDAAQAWDAKAKELYGQYARLNFPAA